MLNTNTNLHDIKTAQHILKQISDEMKNTDEENNPHINAVIDILCIEVDDAIGYLESFKSGLQKAKKNEPKEKFIYSDGGRSKYFKAENVGDCVVRAICNATGKDYKEVYDSLNQIAKSERKGKRKRGKSTSRNGVYKGTIQKYIEDTLGWKWVSTMKIGSGCQKHLNADEFDSGTYIIEVSKHLTCMKNGTIYDTYDPSRDGTRCVYGYWHKAS